MQSTWRWRRIREQDGTSCVFSELKERDHDGAWIGTIAGTCSTNGCFAGDAATVIGVQYVRTLCRFCCTRCRKLGSLTLPVNGIVQIVYVPGSTSSNSAGAPNHIFNPCNPCRNAPSASCFAVVALIEPLNRATCAASTWFWGSGLTSTTTVIAPTGMSMSTIVCFPRVTV